MSLFYCILCFIWALFIRKKNDFEQLFFAFFSTMIVTPIFGNRLYKWIAEYDIKKIKAEKEYGKQSKEYEKDMRKDRLRRYEEYLKTPLEERLQKAINYKNTLIEHSNEAWEKFGIRCEETKRLKELDGLIAELKEDIIEYGKDPAAYLREEKERVEEYRRSLK